MEIKLGYDEIPGPIKLERVSEKEIKVSGKLFMKTNLTIERVGYSSVTFSSSNPGLLKLVLNMVPGKALSLEDGKLKIDLREITSLMRDIYRLEEFSFKKNYIYAKIIRR